MIYLIFIIEKLLIFNFNKEIKIQKDTINFNLFYIIDLYEISL